MRFFCILLLVTSQTVTHAELYDCFTFFNELELLKVRFEELYNVVDHFVLVEASKTFAGDPKPLYFSENAHHFEKYKEKIICVVVDDFPSPTSDLANDRWVREEFQRNAMLRGLIGCNDEDIVLISDLDEIPNQRSICEIRNFFNLHGFYPTTGKETESNNVTLLNENQLICELHMRLFLFYLNQESSIGWNGAVKAAPYWLVNKRLPWNLKILHMHDANLPKIYDAGWHFHSMGGREHVLKKLEAIYLYDDNEIAKNPDSFKRWTETVYKAKSAIIDATYPTYIQEHISYYQLIGWIQNVQHEVNL